MKKRVRVSIVIPAYNEERHLRLCLEAIAAQTVPPFEVVVVNNNSTDQTVVVARSFPFVRVVHTERQGIVFARNAGFDAAKGEVIGRIDADIQLPSDWVEHVQDFYDDDTHTGSAWVGMGDFYNVRIPRLVGWVYELMACKLNKLLLGHYSLWGSCMAMTAPQWKLVRRDVCPRTDIHEDLDLAMHLHAANVYIFYDRSITVRAELRRVHSERHKLWDYLGWWPRTYRVHDKRTWPIVWFVGVFLLYQSAMCLAFLDYVSRRLRR
jgi:glycosyltransferase involved in cell wall biosynthesis